MSRGEARLAQGTPRRAPTVNALCGFVPSAPLREGYMTGNACLSTVLNAETLYFMRGKYIHLDSCRKEA